MENDIIEVKGLEQLLKALKQKPVSGKIGVLGNSSREAKKGGSTTNATVGAVHEYGAPARNIPQRSFLRIPIMENLEKELEKSELLEEDTFKQVLIVGNVKPWMKQVMLCAEAVVDDAFETSGHGKWPAWKDPKYHNEGGMILVDSGQLRRSITSEVSDA